MTRESDIATIQERLYTLMDRHRAIAALVALAQDRGWDSDQVGYSEELSAHLEKQIERTLAALLILDPA